MADAVSKTAATEDQIQRAVAELLDFRRILWTHPPNGELRHKAIAARLRAHGVKPGVPDVLIFSHLPKCPKARGAWIELKTATGRTTKYQKHFHAMLDAAGWVGCICRSVADVERRLDEWGL